MFTELVANNRAMQQADVIATQARIYGTEEAIKIGFADESVTDLEAAMGHFRSYLSGASQTIQASNMGTESRATPGAEEGDKLYTQDEFDTAKAEAKQEGIDEAKAASAEQKTYEQGVEDERQRVTGILDSEHAKGAAAEVAVTYVKQGQSVETAEAALSVIPKALASVETIKGAGESTDSLGDLIGDGAGADVDQSLVKGSGALTGGDDERVDGAAIAAEYKQSALTGANTGEQVYVG